MGATLSAPLLLLLLVGLAAPAPAPRLRWRPAAGSPDLEGLAVAGEVEWAGIPGPLAQDEVRIFLIPRNNSQVDAWPVVRAPTWASGCGTLSMRLPNYRHPVLLRYYSRRSAGYLAESDAIPMPPRPMHGHLSLAEDPRAMRVIWVSACPSSAAVQFGTVPGKYDHSVTADTRTWTKADLLKCPGVSAAEQRRSIAFRTFFSPGFVHEALLSGLVPNVRYFYRFGSEPTGWSRPSSFQMAAPRAAVRLLAVADWGSGVCEAELGVARGCHAAAKDRCRHYAGLTSPGCEPLPAAGFGPGVPAAVQTARRLLEAAWANGPPAVLLHAGDISYARGRAPMWDAFLSMVSPVARLIPYIAALGNHDYRLLSGGECGVPFANYFGRPSSRSYFAVSHGPVRIVVVSTEHGAITPATPQGRWLTATLQAVNRSVHPWLVVMGHKPMYSSGRHVNAVNTGKMLRLGLAPVLDAAAVDLAVWGHVHNYERTCAMRHPAACTSPGTTHVVVGTGGHGMHFFPNTHRPGQASRGPPWSARRVLRFGFLRLTADRTSLRGEFVRSDTGSIEDDFILHKTAA